MQAPESDLNQDTPVTDQAVEAEVITGEAGEDAASSEQTVAAAQAEALEMRGLAQRIQADFDNFRRRNASARKEALEEGQVQALTAMLPVLDNLDRAVDAAKDSADASLREGVELVLKQFRDTFAKLGVEEIPAEGEPFDHNWHHAVLQAEGGPSGQVAEVLQKGYRLGEKVLRYSMVKVYA